MAVNFIFQLLNYVQFSSRDTGRDENVEASENQNRL